ncbi:MAG: sugar phosphate nucleotidyltransferase [Chloroflexota bacterium]|nr:sugar phosphate nucleotidyltransferase [Chloroflexota bacterium]
MLVDTCKEAASPPLLVLAGGFGTRLQGVLGGKPKALAPVRGRPFLAFLLDDWVASGVKRFVFILHYKADQIEEFVCHYFSSSKNSDVTFVCLIEPAPMGTGGAIRFATTQVCFPDEILVVNADTWLPGGVRLLLRAQANCIASVSVDNAARFGGLDIEGDLVVGFREKDATASRCLINGGAYRLRRDLFTGSALPLNFSIETEILARLASERILNVIEASEGFIDIGVPEDYEKFKRWVARGEDGKI